MNFIRTGITTSFAAVSAASVGALALTAYKGVSCSGPITEAVQCLSKNPGWIMSSTKLTQAVSKMPCIWSSLSEIYTCTGSPSPYNALLVTAGAFIGIGVILTLVTSVSLKHFKT